MTKKKLLDTYKELRRAYRYIKNPKTWTRGTLGRDSTGYPVVDLKNADQVCSYGALMKTAKIYGKQKYETQSEKFLMCGSDKNIIYTNDKLGYDATVKMWIHALKIARGAAAAAVGRGTDEKNT